jgi:hypothetical protein
MRTRKQRQRRPVSETRGERVSPNPAPRFSYLKRPPHLRLNEACGDCNRLNTLMAIGP